MLMWMLALDENERDFVTDLFETYQNYMLVIARRILLNQNDAEDALQDAMLKIIKYIDKCPHEDRGDAHQKVVALIGMAARSAALDTLEKRTKKRRQESSMYHEFEGEEILREYADNAPGLDELTILAEEQRAVQDALLSLSVEIRETVSLIYGYGFSCEEAAEFLGVTRNAIYRRLYMMRKKLKSVLEGIR